MIDPEQVERYRHMTPAERFEVWAELADLGVALWEANLSSDEIERRWAIWRREHDLADRNMLQGFRSAR